MEKSQANRPNDRDRTAPAGASEGLSGASLGGACLAVASLATLWLLHQRPNFLSGYDYVRMHAFYKEYFRESVLGMRLPLWNPHVGLGRPFLADIETEALYPPNLLVVPLGVTSGVVVGVLLHMMAAVYGGARLARKIGARAGAGMLLGTGLALASPFTARLSTGMIPVYFTLSWWPVLLWLGAELQDRWDREWAALFALVLAMALLAGNPPIFYVECLGLAVFLLLRESWPRSLGEARGWVRARLGLAASAAIGIGLCAAALVPFAELVSQGDRPLHAAGFATANGMPPASWLSLILPASSDFAPNWEFDLYCGLVPLFLSVAGLGLWRDRNARALIGLGILGGLMAAGDRTPFLGWAAHVLPGASALRLPSRYGIWLATSVLGLASLAASQRGRGARWAVAPLAVVAAGWIVWLRPYVAHATGPGSLYLLHAAAALAAAALAWIWLGRDWWRLPRGLLGAALAAACAADWMGAVALESPVYSAGGRAVEPSVVRDALLRGGLAAAGRAPPRIAFDPSYLCENSGMSGGFSSFLSYANPALDRVWTYLHLAAGVPESGNDFIRLPSAVWESPAVLRGVGVQAVVDLAGGRIARISPAEPRVFMAGGAWVVPDWTTAERMMADGHDFRRVVLVEAGSAPESGAAPVLPGGSAEISRYGPEAIDFKVDSPGGGILVVAEAWYPGWVARVSGKQARVFPVNGWMRGVSVPPGESSVAMRYSPGSLGQGALVSLACAVVLLALVFVPGRPQAVSSSL